MITCRRCELLPGLPAPRLLPNGCCGQASDSGPSPALPLPVQHCQGLCDDDAAAARLEEVWDLPDAEGKGPVYFVEGSASEAASLRQAGASTARALIYLARAGEWAGSWRC